jgi:hypothetical protein
MSVYLSLTRAFNEGALRAILSSGQAVVVHRLALMSNKAHEIIAESAAGTLPFRPLESQS